jgi:hypothetical protein
LRRRSRDGDHIANVVCTLRTCIDPAGYAVLQEKVWTFSRTAGVRVNVEQARNHKLAVGIDCIGRRRQVTLDSTAAMRPAEIATSRIASKTARGVDDASASDKEIVFVG